MSIDPYPAGTVGIICILKDGPQSIASAGSVAFVTAFFETVAAKLEKRNWGARFPILMRDFYGGEDAGVPYEKASAFRQEIKTVQKEFRNLDVSDIVWNPDFEQIEAKSLPQGQPLNETYSKLFGDLADCLEGLDICKGGKILLMNAHRYLNT